MFKLKFEDTKSREFLQAYSKVMQYPSYKDSKLAYNIAKIGRKFDQEFRLSQEIFVKLLKQYSHLDENGDLAPREEDLKDAKGVVTKTKIPNTYVIKPEFRNKSEGGDDSWPKALKDFDSTEFEIPCHKLKVEDLQGVGLSPFDFMILESMILDPESVVKAVPDPIPLNQKIGATVDSLPTPA